MFVTLSRRSALWKVFALGIAIAAGIWAVQGALGRRDELAAGGRLRPLERVEAEDAVALTFDLDYGDGAVPTILAALARSGVRATFFVSGTWAETYPEVGQAIVQAGHEIGALGFRRRDMSELEASEIRDDLSATLAAIGTFAPAPTLFRPPLGRTSDRLLGQALELGLTTVTWSLEPGRFSASAAARRMLRLARPGSIIRLPAGELDEATPALLEELLARLASRRLQPVPLGPLLRGGE